MKFMDYPRMVESAGLIIDLRETFSKTCDQFGQWHVPCAVLQRKSGKVALVITSEDDYRAVIGERDSLLNIYALPLYLARLAHE